MSYNSKIIHLYLYERLFTCLLRRVYVVPPAQPTAMKTAAIRSAQHQMSQMDCPDQLPWRRKYKQLKSNFNTISGF